MIERFLKAERVTAKLDNPVLFSRQASLQRQNITYLKNIYYYQKKKKVVPCLCCNIHFYRNTGMLNACHTLPNIRHPKTWRFGLRPTAVSGISCGGRLPTGWLRVWGGGRQAMLLTRVRASIRRPRCTHTHTHPDRVCCIAYVASAKITPQSHRAWLHLAA